MSEDTALIMEREIGVKTPGMRSFSVDDMDRAKAARAERKAWAKANLKMDFLENVEWVEWARELGLTLPRWYTPCTPGGMSKWLRELGLSLAWYQEQNGYQTYREWIDANPRWPLRAFVGLCLEVVIGG